MTKYSPVIPSITRGPRRSNFELLRILAMFMVLTVHADFISLGVPSAESIAANPVRETIRIVAECIAICGVDIFVLISGWFGIRPSVKGFTSFCFQVLFFYGASFAVTAILGITDITPRNILAIFCLDNNGWFILSYAILYAMAPVLNSFLEHAGRRTVINTLLFFFVIETVWGCIQQRHDFANGYSAMSFCGLYLLSGYVRRWHSAKSMGGGILCLALIALSGALLCIQKRFGLPGAAIPLSYCSPLVIALSLSFILWFSRMNLGHNRAINFIASSAFAVYLLHDNTFTMYTLYVPLIQRADLTGGLAAVALTMAGVFALAVLLDQPRKWLWKFIANHAFKA